MDVRVLDWSDSGVRLLMPLDLAAHRHDLLDLTAWESNLWPIKGKKVQMRGRVVRVARHGDCPHCEVGLHSFPPSARRLRESSTSSGCETWPPAWL